MSESAAELSTGQVFAGWRVERELARGGMGVLYLARHPRLPRTDVIKVLPPWLSSDTRFRERFLREATRMSTLSHPHLMPIHDSGEAEGTLYLVMPYIAGGDLRHLLRAAGPLPPARAGRLIVQIAAALDAAHRVGVVHRDVKPENVLLASVEPDDTDHALLTDFGISREDMGSNSLTATGELLLTPAYAAPEQVLGKVVDARADQYALGCILFELLSGRPPYVNDVQVVMLLAHIQEPVPQLAAELGLPPAIDGVLAKAMAKAPEDRYENCRALAQAAVAALDVTVSTPRPAIDLRDTSYAPPPPPANTPPPWANTPPPTGQPPRQLPRDTPPNAFTPSFTPAFGPPGQPPGAPVRRRRKLWIGALVVVVLAAAVAVIVAVSGGGGGGGGTTASSGSSPSPSVSASASDSPSAGPVSSAAFAALLARVPADVRPSCKDTTAELPEAERPFVVTRASCSDVIDGRTLTIAYRTVPGTDSRVQLFRNTVLGIGGSFHSPGNCRTFESTDPTRQGSKGYGEVIDSPPLVGSLWCDTDGTEAYLPKSAAPGNTRILTQAMTSAGGAKAESTQRVQDLAKVLPAE